MARRSRRHGSVSIAVDADVDIAEVLEELSDQDLIEELEERGAMAKTKADKRDAPKWEDTLADLRDAYERRDGMHFGVLLIRMEAALLPPQPTPGLKKEPA